MKSFPILLLSFIASVIGAGFFYSEIMSFGIVFSLWAVLLLALSGGVSMSGRIL